MNANQWIFVISVTVGIVWILVGIWPILRYPKTEGKNFFCPNRELQDWLAQQLATAKKSILIASDDLSKKVYNKGCIDALCSRLLPGSNIVVRVLLGPSLRDKNNPVNKLMDGHHNSGNLAIK